MNSKLFYKYSLILPLLPPLLVMPLWFVRDSINEDWALILIIIAYSGIVGGIPYLILATALLIWMGNKELASVKKALLFSPVFMLPIFAICLGLYTIIFERHPSPNEYFFSFSFFGVFIILFGYAYVGLVFGLEKLFRTE